MWFQLRLHQLSVLDFYSMILYFAGVKVWLFNCWQPPSHLAIAIFFWFVLVVRFQVVWPWINTLVWVLCSWLLAIVYITWSIQLLFSIFPSESTSLPQPFAVLLYSNWEWCYFVLSWAWNQSFLADLHLLKSNACFFTIALVTSASKRRFSPLNFMTTDHR